MKSMEKSDVMKKTHAQPHEHEGATILPAKSNSDVMFCLQSY